MNVFVSAFLLGLLGSLHCIGMCGPLALALPINTSNTILLTKGQLLYNLGRTVSYSILGILAGVVGFSVKESGFHEWLSIVTGIMLLFIFFHGYTKKITYRILSLPYKWITQKINLDKLLQKCREKTFFLFLFGIVNGFLPCGFVYIALAGAVNTSNLFMSMMFMMCFGLGTIPLMATLIHGRKLLKPNPYFAKLLPIGTLILAFIFILRGSGLGIPYLSPNLSSNKSCCHSIHK